MTYLFELEHSINSEIWILKFPLKSAQNIMKMLLHKHKTLKTSKTCLTTLTHQNMLYNLNWRKKDSFPAREVDTRSGVCLMKTRKKTKIKSSQISWLDAIKIASPLSADCILTEGLPQHAHCRCGGASASSQPLWWDLKCSYMMSLYWAALPIFSTEKNAQLHCIVALAM